MHGGFENETPNIPTNTIQKLDLLTLFKSAPQLYQKVEQVSNKKNRSGSASEPDTNDGKSTPPMRNLASSNNKIRLEKIEFE